MAENIATLSKVFDKKTLLIDYWLEQHIQEELRSAADHMQVLFQDAQTSANLPVIP